MSTKENNRDQLSQQESDIYDIHDAAFREVKLPEEGRERGPIWLYAVILLTFAFGFFYIGFYWGEFSYEPHLAFVDKAVQPAESGAEEVVPAVANGKQIYTQLCQACHQANGAGVSGAFPTLVGTTYVVDNDERLSGILLHGLVGELEIEGELYNGNMPAWGQQLNDEEVAAVINYIRTSFGNQADSISVESVQSVREQFGTRGQWTVEELNTTFQ